MLEIIKPGLPDQNNIYVKIDSFMIQPFSFQFDGSKRWLFEIIIKFGFIKYCYNRVRFELKVLFDELSAVWGGT